MGGQKESKWDEGFGDIIFEEGLLKGLLELRSYRIYDCCLFLRKLPLVVLVVYPLRL